MRVAVAGATWSTRVVINALRRHGVSPFVFGQRPSDKIAGWGRSSEAVNKLGALSKRGAPYFAVGIDKLQETIA